MLRTRKHIAILLFSRSKWGDMHSIFYSKKECFFSCTSKIIIHLVLKKQKTNLKQLKRSELSLESIRSIYSYLLKCWRTIIFIIYFFSLFATLIKSKSKPEHFFKSMWHIFLFRRRPSVLIAFKMPLLLSHLAQLRLSEHSSRLIGYMKKLKL